MFEVGDTLIYIDSGIKTTVTEVHDDHIMTKEDGDLWGIMVFEDEYNQYNKV